MNALIPCSSRRYNDGEFTSHVFNIQQLAFSEILYVIIHNDLNVKGGESKEPSIHTPTHVFTEYEQASGRAYIMQRLLELVRLVIRSTCYERRSCCQHDTLAQGRDCFIYVE